MADAESPVLDVRGLAVSYLSFRGPVNAVSDVSFSIDRGEVFGLAGESGSGKSTVAMALLRVLRPPAVITGGEVIIMGQDVLLLDEKELRQLRWRRAATVFQSALNVLNPVLRVEDQIVDVIRAHEPVSRAQASERAAELLRTVGLGPDRLRSYPHQLSGGMRQRVVIAIALALNPDLLILDEPTTALDVVVQREIMQELKELQEARRFATLFITHDLSLLAEFSTRIAIMYAGEIVEVGAASDIFAEPLHPYTRGLRDSFPSLDGELDDHEGIGGAPPDMLAPPTGCRFHPRCPNAMRRCAVEAPVSAPVDSGSRRQVACHLYE